ncbi:hypothetical protein [Priestia megaterium]|uniref:hypothetical protein n=1 Tax=Priestia megaterium TaxID=1404 RepID=UPI000BFC468D|nr:hypothetical protein [Priestia megaterium]PGO60646.1 hypothetical protein CN981_08845 [Priestia megaterium]
MKNLYTEKQYKEWCALLDKMANEDDVVENISLYTDIKDWEEKEKLSKEALDQMGKRLEEEFMKSPQ